jgi:hypothetical protein
LCFTTCRRKLRKKWRLRWQLAGNHMLLACYRLEALLAKANFNSNEARVPAGLPLLLLCGAGYMTFRAMRYPKLSASGVEQE